MPAAPAKPVRLKTHPLEELTFYIGRAYYNYKVLLERTLVELGLDQHVRPGMGHILFALFEDDDCNIKDIVARARLTFPTITVLLTRMEKASLVERRPDPDDGRAVRIRLTPVARSIEKRCYDALRRIRRVLHAGMTPRQVRRLKQLMSTMIDSMRTDIARSLS